jgi:excisionase family DNA binding protein
MNTDRPMTVAETALFLGVSKARVLQFIRAGRLPATKFGPAWVLEERDLVEFKRIPRKPGRPEAA